MELNRTLNAKRNIVLGFILMGFEMLMAFIVRTIMIYTIGIEYVGLNSLFTSILQVLNLAELGVGSAIVYSMYKPIVDNDESMICKLMQVYKIYYRAIGAFILVVGLIVLPFVPNIISGDVPADINVYIIYLINLGSTVSTYWLFAYKNCLFMAHQRNDVVSRISLGVRIVQYTLQILVLVCFKSYYLYLLLLIIAQIFINIITSLSVDKQFPDYKAKGKLEKSELRKINVRVASLFTSKIGEVILTASDNIIISIFLGLGVLSIYSNYSYISISVFSIISVLMKSLLAGVGNMLITESKETNNIMFRRLLFIIMFIGGLCCSLMLSLYQPFISLWVGNENKISLILVVILVATQYIRILNQVYILYRDAAAIWQYDRLRPFASTLVNLVLNVATVTFLGLYGVLLSTFVSVLFYGLPLLIRKVNIRVLETKSTANFGFLMYQGLVFVLTSGLCFYIAGLMSSNSLVDLIFIGIVNVIIFVIVYALMFFKTDEFKYLVSKISFIKR